MLTPYRPEPVAPQPVPGLAPVSDEQSLHGDEAQEGVNWARLIAAIRRHKWLIGALVLLGCFSGIASKRFIPPEYQVSATIYIGGEGTPQDGGETGPIRATSLLQSSAWLELLRSYAVVDPVVRRLGLYVIPAKSSDADLFEHIQLGSRLLPGHYTLEIQPEANRFTIRSAKAIVERGTLGDSVGRAIGLAWVPPASAMRDHGTVDFELITPREASVTLNQRLQATLIPASSFLHLRLTGGHSHQAAATLNDWIRQFVTVAEEMKRAKVSELTKILGVQLSYAEAILKKDEIALESFRVNAITQPTEGVPLAAGLEATHDPVMQDYFNQKVAYENTRRDRESLERLVQEIGAGKLEPEAFFALPSVLAAAPDLRTSLDELQTKQAQLRAARQVYTEEYKTVRDLRAAVQQLQGQTIPRAAAAAIQNLRQRENDLDSRIQGASQELRQIPARTIEEMRLRREVAVADNLYRSLQSRYAEARLAEASATPDVSVLDSAVAPQRPESNKASRLVLMIVLASIGAAFGLAILLDRLDRRFRYPEQATSELHLPIVGAIPALRQHRRSPDPIAEAQVVESFRALRLQLQHLKRDAALLLTVSSPGSGDGKSLLSANLALSFADSGHRTLLVDGDIRRGTQHSVFGANVQPGLTDYLAGRVGLEQILQSSSHERLTFISRGTRMPGGPELLASSAMAQLTGALRARFDAVIFDSPPLGAGIDPLALAVYTTNLLIVLRIGETDRKLASAKLQAISRLPIRVVGAALNEVRAEGIYRYYSYGYEDGGALVSAGPLVSTARA